ncbi:MAG: hypothetical protein IJ613_09615, partial [Muribaculaceae bacterium]|nr:hypothetical protein [Muribaculaceae bacterium]
DISFYIAMGIAAFICGVVMASRKGRKEKQKMKSELWSKMMESEKEEKTLRESRENSDSYIGTIPWGDFDLHNGYSQYYKGEIRNGVPHSYGGVYEYGGDIPLYSGIWEDGHACFDPNEIDLRDLTDEELRDIMHDRL